jgi:hypothetical protein
MAESINSDFSWHEVPNLNCSVRCRFRGARVIKRFIPPSIFAVYMERGDSGLVCLTVQYLDEHTTG